MLRPASDATLREFRQKSSTIVSAVASRYKEVEMTKPMSDEARHAMHVDAMERAQKTVESFLMVPSVPLITEYMAWLADRVPREGMTTESFVRGLGIHQEVVEETLSEAAAQEVSPYFDFMIREFQRIAAKGGQ